MSIGYEPRWDIPALPSQFRRGSWGEQFVMNMREKILNGSIEVKTDAHYIRTQRWYVEYRQLCSDGLWRPSGIYLTEAESWAFVAENHDIIFCVGTAHLKRAFRLAGKDKKNWKECKGSDHPTKGIVVDHNHFFLTADKAVAEYNAEDDFARSVEDCYAEIRDRVKKGGPGWPA